MYEEGMSLDHLLQQCKAVGIPFIVIVRERSGGGSVLNSSVKLKAVDSKAEDMASLTEVPGLIQQAKTNFKQKGRTNKQSTSTKAPTSTEPTAAAMGPISKERDPHAGTSIDVEILGVKTDRSMESKTKRRISFNCQARISASSNKLTINRYDTDPPIQCRSSSKCNPCNL